VVVTCRKAEVTSHQTFKKLCTNIKQYLCIKHITAHFHYIPIRTRMLVPVRQKGFVNREVVSVGWRYWEFTRRQY